MINRIISWYLERAVVKARKRYYDQFKIEPSKIDLSKVPVPGITGDIKGSSNDGQKREHSKKFL